MQQTTASPPPDGSTLPQIPRSNFAFLRDSLRAASSQSYTLSPLATAVHAWATGTTATYLAHLRPLALLHARNPSLSHSDVLTSTLHDMAIHSRSATAARGLLSAVRQLETLGLLPATVTPFHWAMARSLQSIAAPPPPQLWATTDLLLFLAHKTHSPSEARTTCLAFLSFSQLLRIGEAASIRPDDLQSTSLAFFDQKVGRTWVNSPLGPWAAAWASRLSTLPTTATQAGGPFAPSKQHLQQTFHSLLADSPWAPFTWHSLRRMGAAALATTGTPLPTICAWGRWHSQAIACQYTRHPPGWTFPVPALLPWPRPGSPSPAFDICPTSPEHLWPPSLHPRLPTRPRHEPSPAPLPPQPIASASLTPGHSTRPPLSINPPSRMRPRLDPPRRPPPPSASSLQAHHAASPNLPPPRPEKRRRHSHH